MSAGSAAGLVLTIDLGALAANWKRLAALSSPAECAAVVKADAYGIGIEAGVPALWAAGCRTFFVALPEEGARVRAAAADATVYVLNGFLPDWSGLFRDLRLRPVLNTVTSIAAWAAKHSGAASALQVDTGMNRLGLSPQEAKELSRQKERLRAASPRLLMSHLACAEDASHPLNRAQLERFRAVREGFPDLPSSLANSAGIHLGSDFHFDMVRPGMGLYGAVFAKNVPPLATVATLEARVLQMRTGRAGETIGYGATMRLAADTRIAILSAGYADGYHRMAGSGDGKPGGSVAVSGGRARILGRVSMDLLAIDASGLAGLAEGDKVELFGPNLPVDEAAAAAGTIGYEFLTGLSRRAARVYISGVGGNPLPQGEGGCGAAG